MPRGRTDLALSYLMDRHADGNLNVSGNIISNANGGRTTLQLGHMVVMGLLTSNSGTLRFTIPFGRTLPTGSTFVSCSFNICCRAGNHNSQGLYIVKGTSGGSGYASFDSSKAFAFYDGANNSRSCSQSVIAKVLRGVPVWGMSVTYASGTNYYFTGNSTNNGYCNNQPVCIELDGIYVTLNTPCYQGRNIPSSIPATPISDDISTVLGNVYSASWTASSSAANNVQLTDSITLPPGTYIVIGQFPGISTAGVFGYHGIPNKYAYATADTDCQTNTIITTLTETTQVWLMSGTSNTMTFSNLERGGLTAIRIR